LREEHSDVRWIMSEENLGYARGLIRGLAAVPADYALIVNPDIVVLPRAIDGLLAFADARPRAGIVGPQLLNPDGSIQDSCRRFYTFRSLLLRRTALGWLFPNARSLRQHVMADFDHRSERAVDWVLGGCMLVRRQARERAGPPDGRFFLYFEDVDWCYRMWQAGWDVLYTPEARFIHRHERASARGAFHRAWWLHLGSLISFYEKWGLVVYAIKKWREPLAVAFLWLLDMAALNGALLAAYFLRTSLHSIFPVRLFPLADYAPLFIFASLLATVTFVLRGRYRRLRALPGPDLSTSFASAGLVALLLLATTYMSRQNLYSRAVLLIFALVFAATLTAADALFASLRARMQRGHLSLERTILVGPVAAVSAWLARRVDLAGEGLDLVGHSWDAAPVAGESGPLSDGELPWLGSLAMLRRVVARYRVTQVIFCEWPVGRDEIRLLQQLRRQHVRVRWVLEDGGLLADGGRIEPFGGGSGLVLEPPMRGAFARVTARLADRGAGLILLALSAIPYLSLRFAKGTAIEAAPHAWRTAEATEGPTLRLVVDAGGRPRRLWWQAPLAWDLLRGRTAIFSTEASSNARTRIWNDLVFAPHEFSPVAVEESASTLSKDPEQSRSS
jgi:GT2 family glycosyltransferase